MLRAQLLLSCLPITKASLCMSMLVTASYDYNHLWCLTNTNIWRGDAVYLLVLPHDTFAFCDLRLVRMYWANSEQVRIMRSPK